MTYEEFKKELRWNVQNMETARGKTIRLLERHMVCGDPMAVHIMNIMNRCMYGREQIMIREDMLCALWMRGKREYIQHWLIRPLYERYGQEGWQSILPEISAGLTEDDEEEDIVLSGENLSYAVCRRHMIVRPVNYERCRQELGNAIYRKIGDVALVLHLLTSEKTGSSLTIQVSRGMVLPWKLTEDQLITEAMMNTCRKMPPRLFLGDDRRKFFPMRKAFCCRKRKGVRPGSAPGTTGKDREDISSPLPPESMGLWPFSIPG